MIKILRIMNRFVFRFFCLILQNYGDFGKVQKQNKRAGIRAEGSARDRQGGNCKRNSRRLQLARQRAELRHPPHHADSDENGGLFLRTARFSAGQNGYGRFREIRKGRNVCRPHCGAVRRPPREICESEQRMPSGQRIHPPLDQNGLSA